MADPADPTTEPLTDLIGGRAGEWDLAGRIPLPVLKELGARGLLCPQVDTRHGGLGLGSLAAGELTAAMGALCSSTRSVATSQGMAAWTVRRLGDAAQHRALLPRLTGGELAAVAFSEPDAGSDLAAIATEVRDDGDHVAITGRKVWTTAAAYADHLVVFGRYRQGAAAVVVPAATPGLTVTPVRDPLGCRAAGHADLELDDVRVPAGAVLGRTDQALPLIVTTALAHGRMSVAWGCVGILRACLATAAEHARTRHQFGARLGDHQLVAGRLADLYAAERTATELCAVAARAWDSGDPDAVTATVLAKHVAATRAAEAAAATVQVLASAGAVDGGVAARCYRDAKLMEIIEGSSEMCRLLLAEHVLDRC